MVYRLADINTGEDICIISVKEAPDVKEYPKNTIVVRRSVTKDNVLDVADQMVTYLQDNCDSFGDNTLTFEFALPLYGGSIIELAFTGVNMNDMYYQSLTFSVAFAILKGLGLYITRTYRAEQSFSKRMEIVLEGLKNVKETVKNASNGCHTLTVMDDASMVAEGIQYGED